MSAEIKKTEKVERTDAGRMALSEAPKTANFDNANTKDIRPPTLAEVEGPKFDRAAELAKINAQKKA